jgi:RNA polymerase sigma factor (sigma-70 family)
VSNETDQDAWAAALRGEGEAFGLIFDRHRDRVRRHSHRLVPTPADAEDVVAITFLEAWRRRDAVRFVDGSMLPWLLVTATNSARNLSRGARRYRALLERLPLASSFEPSPDDDAQRALRSLPLADQQVIALCVLDGYSEREAAAALGVAPGTVKSRLSRAKARLARQLGNQVPTKEATNET